MDAESAAAARRMMADLGLERRDDVSKGGECRVDPHVLAEVEARQQQHASNPIDRNDHRAAAVVAWNTPSNFDKDEVTGQLVNRWSGQGHRAALKMKMQYDDRAEALDNRYGEERRLYLQERGTHSHDRWRTIPQPRAHAPSSRRFRTVGPTQAPIHARPPSPRSFGTIRFGRGSHRVGNSNPKLPAVGNPALQIAAAMRAAAASKTVALSPAPSEPPSAPIPKPSHPEARTSPCKALTPEDPASAVSPIDAKIGLVSSPVDSKIGSVSAGASPSKNPAHDNVRAQVCFNQALWYAAHPGEKCNHYHLRFPERLQYLRPARDQLIKEVTILSKNRNEEDTAKYIRAHPEREWMVEAAQKAKIQVEEGDEDETESYCTIHPYQMAFVRAAKNVFFPKTKDAPPTADRNSSSSGCNDSNESGDKAESTSSSPPPAGGGFLVSTFFDVAGKFLGSHHTPVQAPVQISLNMTSRTSRFDPRELIQSIDRLAQDMLDRTHGLRGVRLAEDGLWVESDF